VASHNVPEPEALNESGNLAAGRIVAARFRPRHHLGENSARRDRLIFAARCQQRITARQFSGDEPMLDYADRPFQSSINQCSAPGDLQVARPRRSGADLQGQHPRDVPSDQGCGSPRVNQPIASSTPPRSIPTCQIRLSWLMRPQNTTIHNLTADWNRCSRKRHSRQPSRAGTDLDAADPVDHAKRPRGRGYSS
jgi:hypothetical protein